MIRVAAAILWRGPLVLVARRTQPPWLAGKWEFPGGKIEPGETAEQCLARELVEELGIECEIGAHVLTTVHAYPELEVEIVAHEAVLVTGELAPTDHDRTAWVALADLRTWDLAAADVPIVEALAAR